MPGAGLTRRRPGRQVPELPGVAMTEALQSMDVIVTGSELPWLPGVRQQSGGSVEFPVHDNSSLRWQVQLPDVILTEQVKGCSAQKDILSDSRQEGCHLPAVRQLHPTSELSLWASLAQVCPGMLRRQHVACCKTPQPESPFSTGLLTLHPLRRRSGRSRASLMFICCSHATSPHLS